MHWASTSSVSQTVRNDDANGREFLDDARRGGNSRTRKIEIQKNDVKGPPHGAMRTASFASFPSATTLKWPKTPAPRSAPSETAVIVDDGDLCQSRPAFRSPCEPVECPPPSGLIPLGTRDQADRETAS